MYERFAPRPGSSVRSANGVPLLARCELNVAAYGNDHTTLVTMEPANTLALAWIRVVRRIVELESAWISWAKVILVGLPLQVTHRTPNVDDLASYVGFAVNPVATYCAVHHITRQTV